MFMDLSHRLAIALENIRIVAELSSMADSPTGGD
jgi:hypothetical protein